MILRGCSTKCLRIPYKDWVVLSQEKYQGYAKTDPKKRLHAGEAHLLPLMQCIISLCCNICLRPVPLIGRLAMDKCREMSRKTRKVLIQ